MPIDIINHVKVWFAQFSNKSIFGEIISNPISIAVLIVIIMCLIVWIVSDSASNFVSFKMIFYLLISVTGLMLLHQNVINQRYEEKNTDLDQQQFIPIGGQHQQLVPRPISKLPEYIEHLQPAGGPLGGSNSRNFPGYANSGQIQIPNITTSDDLLRAVQSF